MIITLAMFTSSALGYSCPALWEELDYEISERDISKSIDRLSRNKASGNGGILNEFLINCKEVLMPCLVML